MSDYALKLVDGMREAESIAQAIASTFPDLSNDEFVKAVRNAEKGNFLILNLTGWRVTVDRELAFRLLLKHL